LSSNSVAIDWKLQTEGVVSEELREVVINPQAPYDTHMRKESTYAGGQLTCGLVVLLITQCELSLELARVPKKEESRWITKNKGM
jgi:hypothetical protein